MKTFRLFISSTFGDFKAEREALQTNVFPEIEKYCAKNGYEFLPIDLRWGVDVKTQLDQKTVDLCLNEVKTCKSYPFPNFLVMLGNRYGWVPLPYMIEKNEFESILCAIDESENREFVEFWYKLDKNQLPASYILQPRYDFSNNSDIPKRFQRDFASLDSQNCDYNTSWQNDENAIRSILQSAVNKLNLANEKKEKYFLSATEQEFDEYVNKFTHDKQSHVYAFVRNIDKSQKNTTYDDNKEYEVTQFRKKICSFIPSDNIYATNITAKSRDTIDDLYLDEFVSKITSFLQSEIDLSISNPIESTQIDDEQDLHYLEAQRLAEDFVGQDELLGKIAKYIDSNSSFEPMIIFGKSGSGKSALIAKAISNASSKNKKIIYRFSSLTPSSSSLMPLMTSLLSQLGIDIKDNKNDPNQFGYIDEKQKDFNQFCYEVHDHLKATKDDVIIFIDAIDQLGGEDELLWLPKQLPANLKIIISVLNDAKYPSDSKYYEILKSRGYQNIFQITELSTAEAGQIIQNKLAKYDRTLQESQSQYILEHYRSVNTPLYLTIACEEARFWGSEYKAYKLSTTQSGIISDFIENLTTLYHHTKPLVTAIFAYIFASRDGLSERELVEILSHDGFVMASVSNKYHENKSGKLPSSVWARIYTQLKDILAVNISDGYRLIRFKHRELNEAAKRFYTYELSQKLLSIVQDIITDENLEFDKSRYGSLHIELLAHQVLLFENGSIDRQVEFISNRANKYTFSSFTIANIMRFIKSSFTHKETDNKKVKWVDNYIAKLSETTQINYEYNRIGETFSYCIPLNILLATLFGKNKNKWIYQSIVARIMLIEMYIKISLPDIALTMATENTLLIQSTDIERIDNDKYNELCIVSKHILANCYKRAKFSLMNIHLALDAELDALEILIEVSDKNPAKWAVYYFSCFISYTELLLLSGQDDEALFHATKIMREIRTLPMHNNTLFIKLYLASLNNIASLSKTDDAYRTYLEEEKLIRQKYLENPELWLEYLINLLHSISINRKDANNTNEAINKLEESASILRCASQKNSIWADKLIQHLADLSYFYKLENKFEEANNLDNEINEILHKPAFCISQTIPLIKNPIQ
jgi:hypothetical protein